MEKGEKVLKKLTVMHSEILTRGFGYVYNVFFFFFYNVIVCLGLLCNGLLLVKSS